jgi:tRNA A-37 threonylcarbamoyl transferase component Bud32
MEQLVGAVIDGKYRVERLLAQGGMGAVFAGTHLLLDRPVAIKIVNAELLADPIMQARFAREARAAARIEHANAVIVYDFGSLENGGGFLVMEMVDGISLRQILNERGPLPLDAAIAIVDQAANALSTAHATGVIHRDIKPENLMVRIDEDGMPIVKVVDFGIAKLTSTEASTQLTRPSELIGTPRYMAPEQFTTEDVDERIDVYALATVCYEMLAGRTPFDGTFSEVIGQHLYAEPPTFASLGVDVPDAVEAVVQRGLAKRKEDRQQTASEFARELLDAVGRDIDPAAEPLTIAIPVGEAPSLAHVAPSSDFELTRAHVADELETRVRPATVVIPKQSRMRGLVVPLRKDIVHRATQARTMAAHLAASSGSSKYWAAPAALALSGFVLFGGAAIKGRGEIPTTPAAAAATSVQATPLANRAAPGPQIVQPRQQEAVPTRSASELRDTDDSDRVDDRDQPTRRADEPRRTQKQRRGQRDNALSKVGRALRIDKHLRNLF